MKKSHCKICGKKLINGRCPGCGMQERYTDSFSDKPEVKTPDTQKRTPQILWGTICAFLIILPILLSTSPFQSLASKIQQQQVVTSIPESIYKDVSRTLSTDGSSVKLALDKGKYIVGTDIPEGTYEIRTQGRMATIDWKDKQNKIDYYATLHKDSTLYSSYLQDVRLYQGAVLNIEKGTVLFVSSNAQN